MFVCVNYSGESEILKNIIVNFTSQFMNVIMEVQDFMCHVQYVLIFMYITHAKVIALQSKIYSKVELWTLKFFFRSNCSNATKVASGSGRHYILNCYLRPAC